MYSICCQFIFCENRYSQAFTVDEGSTIVIKLRFNLFVMFLFSISQVFNQTIKHARNPEYSVAINASLGRGSEIVDFSYFVRSESNLI